MWKRTALLVCACVVVASYATARTSSSAFVLPPPPISTTTLLRGISLRTKSKTQQVYARSALNHKAAAGSGNMLSAQRRRARSHVTRTSMVFGGGGGGGRGPRGPAGLDSRTLATIGFGLLIVFAPGVIFGAFNTLFLVVTVGPLLLSLGVNIYNKVNMVDAPCPVCGVQLQGLKDKQSQCPSCGAMLMAQNGKFEAVGTGYVRDEYGAQQEYTRVGDSGVIDVDAIDVDD